MDGCFPKWVYHKTLEPKVVHTQEELESLGKGWEETPAAFDQESDEKAEKSTGDQDQGNKKPDIKEVDLTQMTNKELVAALVEQGKDEKEMKKLKKDELIALLGAE